MTVQKPQKRDHFRGRGAVGHLAEEKAKGSDLEEGYGSEEARRGFLFLDSAKEAIILLVSGVLVLDPLACGPKAKVWALVGFFVGWCVWKGMRGSFFAWSRLRRMHIIALAEKQEIESNRPQEREELMALYGDKGFSGPLLDTVVDVLMADQERLLRVMLQEEMGFRLEERGHPGVFAASGVAAAVALFLLALWVSPVWVVMALAVGCVGFLGALSEKIEGGNAIAACIWSGMMAAVTFVIVRVCTEVFFA